MRSILRLNQDSIFGQQHRFSTIQDWQSFASRVPISTYDTLEPWIRKIAQGGQNVLTTQPVIAFEETGGSTAGAKLVPYTMKGLEGFQRALLPWLDDLFENHDDLASGSFYWSISPACRVPRVTQGGIPVGLPGDAAYFGSSVGAALARQLAVPAEAGGIADFKSWCAFTLLHLFAREDLSMISVWSPTFLTELLREARRQRQDLVAAIASGAAFPNLPNPDAKHWQARAFEIDATLRQANPDFQTIWPRLRLISCWDQASSAPAAENLRRLFPRVCMQGKGLLATEGVVTVPLSGYDYPVLAIESAFFEFIDPQGRIVLADRLQDGAVYQVIMTTHSGLYRYAIGDTVRIRGFAQNTPLLEFIGRNSTTSDLCGEKLTDAFVMSRIAPLMQSFAMLAPSSDTDKPHYVLLLDEAATSLAQAEKSACMVDDALGQNPQYSHARRLGQLAPIVPVLCVRPLESWLQYRSVEKGQRLGDIKLPALLADTEWRHWVQVSGKTA